MLSGSWAREARLTWQGVDTALVKGSCPPDLTPRTQQDHREQDRTVGSGSARQGLANAVDGVSVDVRALGILVPDVHANRGHCGCRTSLDNSEMGGVAMAAIMAGLKHHSSLTELRSRLPHASSRARAHRNHC